MTIKAIRRTSWAVTAVLLVLAVSLFVARGSGALGDGAVGWLLAGLVVVAIACGIWRSAALRRAHVTASASSGS